MSNSFIEKMAVLYQKVPSACFTSVLLAQACLESKYGQSDLAREAFNFAGIKASEPWTGATYTKASNEERNGVVKKEVSKFRKYKSVEQFVADHANFITSTEHRKEFYADVINAKTVEEQCAALTGKYATDSKYGQKLMDVINAYDLKKYDKKGDGNMVEVINRSVFRGIAGRRPQEKPKYYILHNDAGSMNHSSYVSWLQSRYNGGQASLGFAHYYIDRTGISRVEDTYNGSWSCANYDGNMHSLGYEVCEQLKVSDAEFIANEDMTLRQMAEDMTYYGDTPNEHNIKFHNEFSATSCPARSLALHGGTNASLRRYVIDKIKHYQSLGSTVKEMLAAENGGAKAPTGWIKDDYGWWYRHEDGSYPASTWRLIGDAWYYFKADGYAVVDGWYQIEGKWYFFNEDGSMRTGWLQYYDKWYLLGDDGHMFSKELVERNGQLYYVQEDGSLLVDATIKVNENGEITKV